MGLVDIRSRVFVEYKMGGVAVGPVWRHCQHCIIGMTLTTDGFPIVERTMMVRATKLSIE